MKMVKRGACWIAAVAVVVATFWPGYARRPTDASSPQRPVPVEVGLSVTQGQALAVIDRDMYQAQVTVSRGAGSEVWGPFAVVSIGGMTLITLVLMPTLYSLFEGVRRSDVTVK